MLETLRIKNYALIDDIEIDFANGFNVLTGETGAGKSIIIDALNLVLGARASSDAVRGGEKRATIDAVFRFDAVSKRLEKLLGEREISMDDGELLLSRTVTAEGRSRAYVGGNLVPLSVLSEIGDELVDLHGQHEHQSVLKRERQLELLDSFAGAEADASKVAQLVSDLRQIERRIAELESDDRERSRRIEFLRFEVEDIDKASLHAGEEKELKSRRNIISNAEKIFNLSSQLREALYEREGTSAVDAVDSATSSLQQLVEIDRQFDGLMSQLLGARNAIEEVAGEIRRYTDKVEFDPEELDQINARLAQISDLKRKYGETLEAILDYRDKAFGEINDFEQRDQQLAQMKKQRGELAGKANAAAAALSKKRKSTAKKLDKEVMAVLQKLGMSGGLFDTSISTCDLSLRGTDHVDFLLAANPGEKPKALRQVASGGEISRIMLALKAVFANADSIPTLVFDEIDAGVGGRIAGNVAQKLDELAQSHQVICITHLSQIAAAATTHYNVSKITAKRRSSTSITQLEGKARVEEMARLLSGAISDTSMRHAKELLSGRNA